MDQSAIRIIYMYVCVLNSEMRRQPPEEVKLFLLEGHNIKLYLVVEGTHVDLPLQPINRDDPTEIQFL